MKDLVTAADKKEFIQWFLEHYELKNPEAEWLLQYLSSSEQLLSKVHFTDHFRNMPKAFLMSSTCVQMAGFKFYKNKRVTSDVEKAFLDVHNHPDEDVYVTLFFRDRANCKEYQEVMEALPSPRDPVSAWDALVKLQAELWLDEAARIARIKWLTKEIDLALDLRDKDSFACLSAEYRQLTRS